MNDTGNQGRVHGAHINKEPPTFASIPLERISGSRNLAKKLPVHMLPVLGEDRSSWEQTELKLIAKDRYLLDLFQALKYTEGKFHTDRPVDLESNR